MALNRVWLITRNIHLEWYLLKLVVWQINIHGVRACVKWKVYLWCLAFGGCGLPLVLHQWWRNDKLKLAENIRACAYAWVTRGTGIFACNVAIFLCEIVCCTSYGASLWDSVVGYGVFPRRFYSDCTDQFLFCQQNNYFLDVNSLSHYY